MSRVLALVEGQTEETFVRELLAPHLRALSIEMTAFLAKRRGTGGVPKWAAFKPDLLNLLKQDHTAYVTTMIDFYGMPADWPGRDKAREMEYPEKVEHVELQIAREISSALPENRNPQRLVPYVQCHEFEALLFSDPVTVESYLARRGLAEAMEGIRSGFGSPEEINDGPLTAPSKRLAVIVEGYSKELTGNVLALEIGLQTMRRQCPHFAKWVCKLESLAKGSDAAK